MAKNMNNSINIKRRTKRIFLKLGKKTSKKKVNKNLELNHSINKSLLMNLNIADFTESKDDSNLMAYKILLNSEIKKLEKETSSDCFFNSNNYQRRLSLIDWSIQGYLVLAINSKVYIYDEVNYSKGKLYLIYDLCNGLNNDNISHSESIVDITDTLKNKSNIDLNSLSNSISKLGSNLTELYFTHVKFNSTGDNIYLVVNNGQIIVFDIVSFKVVSKFEVNSLSDPNSNSIPNLENRVLNTNVKDLSPQNNLGFVFSVIAEITDSKVNMKSFIVNFDSRQKKAFSSLTSNSLNSSLLLDKKFSLLNWSDESNKLGIGTADGTVLILDKRVDNKISTSFQAHNSDVLNLEWSKINDGILMTSAGLLSSNISFWNINNAKKLKSINSNSSINNVELIYNNNTSYSLILAYEKLDKQKKITSGIISWNVENDLVESQFDTNNLLNSQKEAQYPNIDDADSYYDSESGVEENSSSIINQNIHNRNFKKNPNYNRIVCFKASKNQSKIASMCSQDGTIRIWNLKQNSNLTLRCSDNNLFNINKIENYNISSDKSSNTRYKMLLEMSKKNLFDFKIF